MRSLSSDIVSEGAFFPQPDPHVPQKEVSHDAREHVMTPPWIFPHLVMIHSKLGFGFLEALFYRPPDAAQPDKGFQAGAGGRITDIEGIGRGVSNGPFDDQPDGFSGQALPA